MLNTLDLVNIVAGIATVLMLIVSIIQTLRLRSSQRDLKQLKRSRNASIWLNISMVLNAYDTIEDARELVADEENSPQKANVLAKITSARRSIVNQYLHLLKEAALDEEEFTEETVQEWKRTGRLENEWRVAQAMKFVQTNAIQHHQDRSVEK